MIVELCLGRKDEEVIQVVVNHVALVAQASNDLKVPRRVDRYKKNGIGSSAP